MKKKAAPETNRVICVVGLGYVGLPLALAFGRTTQTTYGFDVSQRRISDLKKGVDVTEEVTAEEIHSSKLIFTDQEEDLAKADFYIVAVPTPVNRGNQPDLRLVEKASAMVGKYLKAGDIVVYESTVYPGVTEEICAPILEVVSGLVSGQDFKLGYSPERINPGDKEHTLEKVVKVVAGQDKGSTEIIAKVYETVCKAGVFVAANIKTAEAAKVIENTQRDLNIALINELSLIFQRIGINTDEVLEAAGTKWNFLKFTPGLVGGHCIGVDPYYLVSKAEQLGYHPQVIAAGRRVNDYMPEFVAHETVKGMIAAGKHIQQSRVLVLGLTFKENVKDIRNSKIAGTISKLRDFGVMVDGHDPLLEEEEVKHEFSIPLVREPSGPYDALILSTHHEHFRGKHDYFLGLMPNNPVLFDVKSAWRQLRSRNGLIYLSL